MRAKKFVIPILAILALSFVSVLSSDNFHSDTSTSDLLDISQARFRISYTEQNRITIIGDLDFQNQAVTNGWLGNGSVSAPYRIQYLNITNSSVCISITNVTLHYVISSCFINSTDNFSSAIELNNASNGVVEDSSVHHGKYGIKVFRSHGIKIENNSLASCGSSGIEIQQSNGTDIIGNTVDNTGFDSAMSSGGINIYQSYDGRIFDNEAYVNDFGGIRIWLSEDWNVTFNRLHDNIDVGIYGLQSRNVTVSHNDIYDHIAGNDGGIYIDESSEWMIQNNWFSNNDGDGIFVDNCTKIQIVENEFHKGDHRNIDVWKSDNCNITGNLLQGSAVGISYLYSNNSYIVDNIIADFRFEGILLVYSVNNWIYKNDIAFNEIGPLGKEDTGVGNFWDDNISVGNWWGNYDGGENYSIWFEANVDRYPRISLNASQAEPVVYEIGTIGHVMNWTEASALHPSHYEVFVGGVLFKNQTWDGSYIEVNVDGLEFGNHSVTLTVYHVTGNSANSLSYINVIDTTAPTWDETPIDQLFELGDTFHYNLNASDVGGVTYFWSNDTTYFDFVTNGILTNTSFVPAGIYPLEIRVYDVGNNYASANITITIQDTVAPTWDQLPTNQLSEYGSTFMYQVKASDLAGLHHYWVNDTTYFNISISGLLANTSLAPVGVYNLEIRGYDPSDLFCTASITISVCDSIPPAWTTTPEDQIIQLGMPLAYQLEAFDNAGIQNWVVNDTVHFALVGGLLTNITSLEPGIYYLNVSVQDSHGNMLSAIISVTVQEPGITPTIPSTTTPTTSTTPAPPLPESLDSTLLVIAAVAGAIIIIVIGVGMSKRRPK